MMRLLPIPFLFACLWSAEPMFTVRPDRVLRQDADRWLGINLNYLRDHDANRSAGSRLLATALDDLGVRWLRYPGGEKSDFHRFAPPPYNRPQPTALGWYATVAGKRLDFDAYLILCRTRGAEPYVVVACDSPERTGATWDEQLAHAVAWVRYARTREPRVRRWEIGNENWHHQTAPPAEMAAQVVRFARAMKAADPDILVGASGNNAQWWGEFLPRAAADLDFLTCSVYNCWNWKEYGRLLRSPEPDLLADAGHALRAIDALPDGPDRQRLHVVVVETNSRDYSTDGWGHANTLGHALVTFESFGRMLREPRLAAALLWNTRWVDDGQAHDDIFYALDDRNGLTASGQAVALWGRHLHAELLAVDGAPGQVRAHASASPDRTRWTVWLVNRGLTSATVRLDRHGLAGAARGWRLAGEGVDDVRPRLTELGAVNDDVFDLPPLSVTVLAGGD
jgi:hypothetical protein